MFIGDLEISASVRPKIIAEIGINHNGSLDSAKKLCELAAKSGADIIKTQFHIPDEEMSEVAKEIVPNHCDQSIFEIMKNCSLSVEEEFLLKQHIEELGVIYLSTPFSAKAAYILGNDFGVQAFKIGSGECNNPSVLGVAGRFAVPLIISTGMNTLKSCALTFDYINEVFIHLVALLHHRINLFV